MSSCDSLDENKCTEYSGLGCSIPFVNVRSSITSSREWCCVLTYYLRRHQHVNVTGPGTLKRKEREDDVVLQTDCTDDTGLTPPKKRCNVLSLDESDQVSPVAEAKTEGIDVAMSSQEQALVSASGDQESPNHAIVEAFNCPIAVGLVPD